MCVCVYMCWVVCAVCLVVAGVLVKVFVFGCVVCVPVCLCGVCICVYWGMLVYVYWCVFGMWVFGMWRFQLGPYPEENLLGHRVCAPLALIDAVKQFSEVVLTYDPNRNN